MRRIDYFWGCIIVMGVVFLLYILYICYKAQEMATQRNQRQATLFRSTQSGSCNKKTEEAGPSDSKKKGSDDEESLHKVSEKDLKESPGKSHGARGQGQAKGRNPLGGGSFGEHGDGWKCSTGHQNSGRRERGQPVNQEEGQTKGQPGRTNGNGSASASASSVSYSHEVQNSEFVTSSRSSRVEACVVDINQIEVEYEYSDDDDPGDIVVKSPRKKRPGYMPPPPPPVSANNTKQGRNTAKYLAAIAEQQESCEIERKETLKRQLKRREFLERAEFPSKCGANLNVR